MISKSGVLISLFLIGMTAFFYFKEFSSTKEIESDATITDFGAQGDGISDDTKAIQDAIDSVSEEGGGVVTIPEGTYLIDALQSVQLKDNITLDFKPGSIFKAIPNDSKYYTILNIQDVENVKIVGEPKLQGDREQHTGESGEWGMGINIKGANDILLENINITDCWGDGIYIGTSDNQNYSSDIIIKDPVLENNRRQGISVISVKNLEIINPVINNTEGTDPQSGIDIEPNRNTDHLENIEIINLSTENNEGYGLQIYLANFKNSENPVSISVDTSKNIEDGIRVAKIDNIKGEIKIDDVQHLPES